MAHRTARGGMGTLYRRIRTPRFSKSRTTLATLRAMLAAAVALGPLGAELSAVAQTTTVNGNTLAMRSNGASSGLSWNLDQNGFVGTYVTLAEPGDVTISVQASGQAGGGPAPKMNVVVGDWRAGFDVGGTLNPYVHTFSLPAGTHFVRTEYPNDFVGASASASSRSLTVRSLSVTGATVSNVNDVSNALAASDTYIQYGRRGDARLALVGAEPGSTVDVQLKRHAFNWGANAHGTSTALFNNAQYTDFFKTHFNMIVPSRAGKWNNNESTRNVVTSVTGNGYLNTMLNFAEANNMRARLHNLIWANSDGAEQPSWVRNMLNNPEAIDPLTGKSNLDALRDAISNRIGYYVGDGPGGFPELSLRYDEVDIYNESRHTGVNASTDANYWNRYGAAGVADIYAEAAQAAANAGSQAKMYVNEYNVFNWNDQYANWYRQHIEDIQYADGDPHTAPVGGIGIQVYLGTGGGAFQPVRAMQSMQNLSVLGLPMSITEFGVSDSVEDPELARQFVNQVMRMSFGHPDMTTFMYWGFWAGGNSQAAQGASILANADWSLTDIGKMYQDMLGIQDWDGDPANGWTTSLSLPVGPDGTIDFTGFYGDYEITVDGRRYALTLDKGQTDHALVTALSADFNGDGRVDDADLAVWQDGFGLGDVDGNALLAWQRQLGLQLSPSLGPAAAAAVPEPAGWLLLALATLMRRRPRRSSGS
ncbi:MAG: endo-1,4-beta-xylanase [Pirellulales bacterium]|nr:endo-1,4-beta-xylanase [Pirellulales bacterium]